MAGRPRVAGAPVSPPGPILVRDLRAAAATCPSARAEGYTLDGRAGYLLTFAGTDAPAPARLASPVSGWHRVFLGFRGAAGLRVRLAGDPWYRWVETTVRWDAGGDDGEEVFWRDADLTGATFEFLPLPRLSRADRRTSGIACLRLEPLPGGAPPSPHASATRTAGAVIDGHELLGAWSPRTPDEAIGMIAPFVDSDFRRVALGCTCTTMRLVYLTRVGHWLGQDQPLERLHSDHNRRCAAALQTAARDGWDPVDVLIDFARRHDLELWADFRIQQDYPRDYAGGFGYDFNSPLVEAHADWRHVDRGGRVCSHNLSHFHEGWEQHKLALLAELARKGPAGIHLNLMCEMGVLWDFAPHAVERFRQEHGVDPTATDEPPEAWYQFRCDHLTQFMRRLRAQTERIGRDLARPIPIAVQVSGEWAILKAGQLVKAVSQNWLAGFDVGRWAREGLVDVISPSFRRTYKPMFLQHLVDELGAGRDRVQLVPCLGQHDNNLFPRGYEWALYFTDEGEGVAGALVPFGELDAWRVLREACDLYRQGADAVSVWEMGHAPVRLGRWNALKRIGDRRFLEAEFGTRVGGLQGEPERVLRFG